MTLDTGTRGFGTHIIKGVRIGKREGGGGGPIISPR